MNDWDLHDRVISELETFGVRYQALMADSVALMKDVGDLILQLKAEVPPVITPLTFTLDTFVGYSQNKPVWASLHLGYPEAAITSKIGPFGCAATAIANLCKWVGYDRTPAQVNNELVAAGAFRTDQTKNLIDWPKLPNVYPFLKNYRRLDFPAANPTIAQMNELRAALKLSPIILEVDGIISTLPLDEHFVLALGQRADGAIMICDSWDGANKLLTAYTPSTYSRSDREAKAIYSIRYYAVTP